MLNAPPPHFTHNSLCTFQNGERENEGRANETVTEREVGGKYKYNRSGRIERRTHRPQDGREKETERERALYSLDLMEEEKGKGS